MTLTPDDLARLREVAIKASPGDWQRGLWPDTFTINCSRYDICTIHDDADGRPLIGPEIALCAEEDAEHIAAFDPPTALALLAALAEAQQRAEKAEAKATQLFDALEKTERALESKYDATHLLAIAEAERDRLKAQVSAMKAAMGEEWVKDKVQRDWSFCPECQKIKGDFFEGHAEDCTRGRFFAALAAPEGK